MHNIDLILTLTGGLGVALALGFVALQLRLPPIVGYLMAGLLIGPHTPGFVANRALADQLAEVGIILLMFGVGLHFHIKDLLAVRNVALTGALGQIVIATALATVASHGFGWSWHAAIVFGVALSVASTVVLIRVLADNRDLHSHSGRIAVGWLVVEDIFTIFVLVLLPATAGATTTPASLAIAFGIALLKLAGLTAITLIAGGRYIPRLLSAAARTQSRELFTLTVLVIALGIAVGAAVGFGVSMALGAFLAGMVVGQSEFSNRAASEALPMRDAFAVLFFVSVGMLFDPGHLLRAPVEVAVTLAIVVVAKPLAALLIVLFLGYGVHIALRVSVALAQIGEFSFILATLAGQLGILPAGATDSLVAAAIVSITLNPLLYRLAHPIERAVLARPRLRKLLTPSIPSSGEKPVPALSLRAIVVGYGPVGQTVSQLLQQFGIQPVIIELNIDTVRSLKDQGAMAVYGDATQQDTLVEAGVSSAIGLMLTSPASPETTESIRVAREINPQIRVLVRSAFVSQAEPMRHAGADMVFSGEAEVAMAMIEYILHDLGATPEQMDQERQRVRNELYA